VSLLKQGGDIEKMAAQRGWRCVFIRVSEVFPPGFPSVRVLEDTANAHVLG
jgi:hypothetical protein